MAECGTLNFERNMDADRGYMRTEFEGAKSRDRFSDAENCQKWTILNRYISVTTSNIDKKKYMVFEHDTCHLFHGQVHLFCFGYNLLFFFTFFFLLSLFTFKQQNADGSYCKLL